jgi:mRNA-degrading endonuclease RelE of RelBE toxin-antitoxin system
MAYKIIIAPRTQKEYEQAIEYYALHSQDAPINFIDAVYKAYTSLAQNPLLRIRYRNIRAIKIKRFPYLIYFTVNEKNNTVKVLSCFHYKRNPNKKPH